MELDKLKAGSLEGQRIDQRLMEGMSDAEWTAPSALPGWSRSHVIAHLVGNTLAQTRQLDYAREGKQIEVYTGGDAARAEDIERRSTLEPGELARLLSDAHSAWEVALSNVDERLAGEPVAYRDGVVTDVIVGRWMESLVHAVDLGLPSYTARDWPAEFCVLLLDFLRPRLPEGQQVRVEATDAPYDETTGTGEAVHLRGPVACLAGFLADRADDEGIDSLAAPLGELGPYSRGSHQR